MESRAVLFFSANPSSVGHLNVYDEYKRVHRALLAHSAWWDALDVVPEWSLKDDVLTEIHGRQPQVLHFAGHGERDGGMVLEASDGEVMTTDAVATADYLRRLAAPRVPLVVLNLCYSTQLAERLVAGCAPDAPRGATLAGSSTEGTETTREVQVPESKENEGRDDQDKKLPIDAPASIDVAIGMAGPVSDDAAVEFSRQFYEGIAAGQSVAEAFATARAVVQTGHHGRAVPKLFQRDGVDPGQLFVRPERSRVRPAYASLAWGTLVAVAAFLGLVVFYRFYEPVFPGEALDTGSAAAAAFVLWLLVTPLLVLHGFYRSGRPTRRRGPGSGVHGLARPLLAALCTLGCSDCLPLPAPSRETYRPVLDLRWDERPERPGDVSYGYLIFRYRPDPANASDAALCRMLFSHLDPRPGGGGKPTAATYWPTTGPEEANTENCPTLLRMYDHAFASRIIDSLPNETRWQVFLMAQVPGPFGQPATSRVCVDLTEARDEPELRYGLAGWRALMAAGPEEWEPSGLADRAHRMLAWFFSRQQVYVGCQ